MVKEGIKTLDKIVTDRFFRNLTGTLDVETRVEFAGKFVVTIELFHVDIMSETVNSSIDIVSSELWDQTKFHIETKQGGDIRWNKGAMVGGKVVTGRVGGSIEIEPDGERRQLETGVVTNSQKRVSDKTKSRN